MLLYSTGGRIQRTGEGPRWRRVAAPLKRRSGRVWWVGGGEGGEGANRPPTVSYLRYAVCASGRQSPARPSSTVASVGHRAAPHCIHSWQVGKRGVGAPGGTNPVAGTRPAGGRPLACPPTRGGGGGFLRALQLGRRGGGGGRGVGGDSAGRRALPKPPHGVPLILPFCAARRSPQPPCRPRLPRSSPARCAPTAPPTHPTHCPPVPFPDRRLPPPPPRTISRFTALAPFPVRGSLARPPPPPRLSSSSPS